MREFDVVVMGAGVAGEVAAGRLGQSGLSVAIVEGRLVGLALAISSSTVLASVSRSPGYQVPAQ